jgi:hypothetical protein
MTCFQKEIENPLGAKLFNMATKNTASVVVLGVKLGLHAYCVLSIQTCVIPKQQLSILAHLPLYVANLHLVKTTK